MSSVHKRWRAFYLFYHADLDRLLTDLVSPTVRTLTAQGFIDRFFFVRYSLGGPHVRLRLRVTPGRTVAVAAALQSAAEAFFAARPSLASLSEEAIRRENRAIVTADPGEDADVVYPDNALVSFPFQCEVERYGGPALVRHSLDFFTLSSTYALRVLAAGESEPRSRRLAEIARLLACLALGLARNVEEFLTLLAYPFALWGQRMELMAARGDEAFAARREALCSLVDEEIERYASEAPLPLGAAAGGMVEAGRCLGWELRHSSTRSGIGISHLHMTANRFGLKNPEEVYIGRMLWRAARELTMEPCHRVRLDDLLAGRAAVPPAGGRLHKLVLPMLAQFTGQSALSLARKRSWP